MAQKTTKKETSLTKYQKLVSEGALTNKQEQQFADILDKAVDCTKIKGIIGWGLELIDDKVFYAIIHYLDKKVGDVIPANMKDVVNAFALSIVLKDYKAAEDNAAILLGILIDIPNLSEDREVVFFSSVIVGLVNALKLFIK